MMIGFKSDEAPVVCEEGKEIIKNRYRGKCEG